MDNLSEMDLLKMISITHRKTQMYFNTQVKPLGLTNGLIPFLMITCENGKMVQNKFCEILDMNKSTVAKMLNKLEMQGYVIRRQNDEDSRSIDVYPTEEAFRIYPCLQEIGKKWELKITEGMTKMERTIFVEMMYQVAAKAGGFFSDDFR